jgi:hypothetical protein
LDYLLQPEGKNNMAWPHAFEGTGEELQEYLKQHPHDRFRLILLPANSDRSEHTMGTGLRRGMFPQLRGLTEEDFKAAEWRSEDTDL